MIIEKCIAPEIYGTNAGREMFMAYGHDPRFTGFGWTEEEAASQLTERQRDAAALRARQMNAELPQATRDVLAVKGMI